MPAKAAAVLHSELCSQSVCLWFGSANFEAMGFPASEIFLQGQPAIRSELFQFWGIYCPKSLSMQCAHSLIRRS
jgi:hypothetical protein